jgi:hypothetical protein
MTTRRAGFAAVLLLTVLILSAHAQQGPTQAELNARVSWRSPPSQCVPTATGQTPRQELR